MEAKAGIFSLIVFLAGLFFGYSYFELKSVQIEKQIVSSVPDKQNVVINKYITENKYENPEDDSCVYAFTLEGDAGDICVAGELIKKENDVKDLYNSIQKNLSTITNNIKNDPDIIIEGMDEISVRMKELDDLWWRYSGSLCENENLAAGSGSGTYSAIRSCELELTKEYYKHLKYMEADWVTSNQDYLNN